MIAARVAVFALLLAACGGPAVIWTGHTPDRRRTVEVIEHDDRQYVVVDGQRRAAYHAIAGWSIELSDDGHIAFAARVGAHWVVVHDGRAGASWDAVGELLLAPGNRLTYIAERAGRWHVVTDGVVGPPHDIVLADSLTASPDGRRIAYVASDDHAAAGANATAPTAGANATAPTAGALGPDRAARRRGHRAYVDGKPGPRFDGIGELAFTADSARVVYAARQGRTAQVVVDQVAGPAWRAVDHLTLSPSGHRVAYAALEGDLWRVIVDDVHGPAVDQVRRIRFSGDAAHVAWLATVADRGVLAVDDRPIAAPVTRDSFAFGPGASGAGYRLAYVAPAEGGGEQMMVDGVAGPTHVEIGEPAWSPDGRVAYSARTRERASLIVDGTERFGGTWVGEPVFSPDGKRLAFLAQQGQAWLAIVDGKPHRFDLVLEDSLAFSADSQHWAVVAGELTTETLFFAVDGTRRVRLEPRELYSAATRHTSVLEPDPEATDLLRRWSEAEANRASDR